MKNALVIGATGLRVERFVTSPLPHRSADSPSPPANSRPFKIIENKVTCQIVLPRGWAKLVATVDIMVNDSGSYYVSELYVHNQAAPVWTNDESSREMIYFEAQ
jgi:hypothetical protein